MSNNNVKPIPDGYTNVTPYLILQNAAEAIDYYKKVFGAVERLRLPMPNGKIAHAEIMIGDSVIMLSDGCSTINSPPPQGASPVIIHLYVKDVDKVFEQAVKLGAKVSRPLENQFYGDRVGCIVDPYGHSWSIATHVEDVSPEETTKRFEGMMKQPQ